MMLDDELVSDSHRSKAGYEGQGYYFVLNSFLF